MKEKILSFIFAVFMTVSMILPGTVAVFADDTHTHSFTSGVYKDNGDCTHSQKCTECAEYGVSGQETLPYTNTEYVIDYSFTGANFKVTAASSNANGMYGGAYPECLTVESLDPSTIITGIDAVIGKFGDQYDQIDISGGKKLEDDCVDDGTTVHITDINDTSFSFSGGTDAVQFKDITVHYNTKADPHSFTSGVYKKGDNGTHWQKCDCCDAYGNPEHTETLPYINKTEYITNYSFTGTNFKVTASNATPSGIKGGKDDQCLTVEALDPSMIITGVDAVVSKFGNYYYGVGISCGMKLEDAVEDGKSVHIINIGGTTFSFTGGKYECSFKDITVHYMEPAPHSFTSGVCKDNGDGTHSGVCECSEVDTVKVAHTYDTTGTCVCGAKAAVLYKDYLVEGHEPIANGKGGLYNRYSYYLDKDGNEVVPDGAVYDDNKEITFEQWYLRTMVQYKHEGGDLRLRFVTMLDENLADYEEAGFIYTVDGKENRLTTTEANTSFIADGRTTTIEEYSQADDFFVMQNTLFEKSVVDLDPEISVTPYVTLMDGTIIEGKTVTFRISDFVK